MSEPKFTPGPWLWDRKTRCVVIEPAATVCRVTGSPDWRGEDGMLANASLITSAPDLYAAIENCMTTLRNVGAWAKDYARNISGVDSADRAIGYALRDARAALAKARGES